ncbi:MAG: cytidylate kinase-like family protein [Clostridia bacterium]
MNTERSIITIGREYGSGGREVGTLVAKKLNIPFYDKEILTRASNDSGLCEELFQTHDERVGLGGMLTGASSAGVPLGAASLGLQMPINQRLFLAQFDAITKLSQEGSCVIVGRCADYVLKALPNVVHVYVYASIEKRIERIMRVEDIAYDQAKELVRKVDKQRKNYYNFFADGNWGLRGNYDLMLRSDGRKPEDLADLIVAFSQIAHE